MKYKCTNSFDEFRYGEIISEYVYQELSNFEKHHFDEVEEDLIINSISDTVLDITSLLFSHSSNSNDSSPSFDGFGGGDSGGGGASGDW